MLYIFFFLFEKSLDRYQINCRCLWSYRVWDWERAWITIGIVCLFQGLCHPYFITIPIAHVKSPCSLFLFDPSNIISSPLTARVIGAPKMILQPIFSIFPCSPLPSGICQTPGLSIPWCCLPISSSVCLVFFPLSLCLKRWFWPDLMNGKHAHTTAVCVSLQS